MRTWVRATIGTLCGGCDERIARGDVYQLIEIPGIKRRKVRCLLCADSLAPDDVPPLEEPVPFEAALVEAVASKLPLDWKQVAANGFVREPGEDG